MTGGHKGQLQVGHRYGSLGSCLHSGGQECRSGHVAAKEVEEKKIYINSRRRLSSPVNDVYTL